MKKNILEETTDKIVNAPKEELQYLNIDILRDLGQIVNLSFDTNGNPIQVKVGDKTYTAGIKTKKDNFIVYDGRILKLENGMFSYITNDQGRIVRVRNIQPSIQLQNFVDQKLKNFGLLGKTNLYSILDQNIGLLQGFIDKGAVGNVFRDFNELLVYYYPNEKTKRLNIISQPTIDSDKLESNYKKENLSRYGLSGNYYMPKNAGADLVGDYVSAAEKDCNNTLTKYLGLALQSKAVGSPQLNPNQRNEYKKQIKYCNGLGKYDDFKLDTRNLDFEIKKSLEPGGFLKRRFKYNEIKKYIEKNVGGTWNLFENKNEIKIKNLIHENLIKVSENRKRILNEERSIVRKRIILLAEKVNIKSKSSRENFCDELLGEMIYLNKQGFDKEVISEQVLDAIRSIFGNSGEGILQSFKQRMAEWLVGKLMPGAEKSWLGGILINVFTDTGILEIPKLTQCSFLTKKIAEAIVEEVPKQMQLATGKTGFLWDTLRNSMLETLEESNFGQHLERGLVDVVCPMIDKVKNRLFGIEDKMKTGLTSKEKETDSSGSVEAG